MKNSYTPKPIDTSDVILPERLMQLAERIAKNVHEVWSQTRLRQGWTYGPKRNDSLKQHPGLVEYELLSEGEKQFDRNTALETLKLITKLGFSISETEPDA